MIKKLFVAFSFLFLSIFFTQVANAQMETGPEPPREEVLEVRVVGILEEKEIILMDKKQLYQKLKLLVTKGSLKDKIIEIENGNIPIANIQKYQPNDQLVVIRGKDLEGKDYFYISDYVRHSPLLTLFLIFIALSILVAGWRGVTSLLGMAISFFIIFSIILPKILQGSNPLQIVILGSLLIIPITFYLSHGLNKKTTVAILGTAVALIITGIFAETFVNAAHLTGFASEEAGFLQVASQGEVNIKGLLLAGIIIGVLGVLDDITVSQSAIVFKLRETNPNMKFNEIYKHSMHIGKDHIASMVNTLILVYTGAALPLLLLFLNNPHPFLEVINYEIIADEIVRTLVGSIGLILAVPITTLIASLLAIEVKRRK